MLYHRSDAFANHPSLPKRQRNQHVQACVRREIASKREWLQTDVHYCHQCFHWVVGPKEWKEHCESHVEELDSKRCGTITYCHTLVRPGYCPFCLGNAAAPAHQRLQSWCRDATLWQHVDSHLDDARWPLKCAHPRCDISLLDGQDLRFHLIDEHGFSRNLPKNMKYLSAVPLDLEKEEVPSKKRKQV